MSDELNHRKTVTSFTNPEIAYEIDLEAKTCSCPAFVRGHSKLCKHLKKELGIENHGGEILADKKVTTRKAIKNAQLFTVGHSNHSEAAILALLKDNEIDILVDVRSKPYSRYNAHFNRPDFSALLIQNGIKYYWGGKYLGGMSDISVEASDFVGKMNRVIDLAQGENVAMMCSEGNPKDCHRAYKLSAWVLRRGGSVRHILPQGNSFDGQEFEDSLPEDWVDEGFLTG